jgi:hypothetical protein
VTPDPPSTETSETTEALASQPTTDVPVSDPGPATPAGASALSQRAAEIADQRPEVAAGAAFAGGVLFALILKRLAR